MNAMSRRTQIGFCLRALRHHLAGIRADLRAIVHALFAPVR
jgi:hypothetical protein